MTKALICRGPGMEVLDVCWGVAASGGCPQAGSGEPVRCAGLHVVVCQESEQPFVFAVEPDATACPVAALGLLPAVQHRPDRLDHTLEGGESS
jgi:hypothetical protein